MSEYAIYRMFDGCDAPYNVEFCGHLVGSRVWTGDDNPTALMARKHVRDGWHTEPPSDQGRMEVAQMAPTSDERDTRIPYRLGTDHYCTYEDEGEEIYVRMGDTIAHFYDTPFGEVELDGELCSVRYGEGGFIDAVSVYVEGGDRYFDCPCDGVFYRKMVEDGKD